MVCLMSPRYVLDFSIVCFGGGGEFIFMSNRVPSRNTYII